MSWLRQLKPRIDEWRVTPADEGTILRGGPLAAAEEWRGQRGDELSDDERAYIEASLALREREMRREQEARAQEQARLAEIATAQANVARLQLIARLLWLIAGIAVFIGVISVATFVVRSVVVRSVEGQRWDVLALSGLQIAGAVTGLVVLGWAIAVSLIYWFDPARLVRWHEAFPEPSGLEGAVKTLDKMAVAILSWIAKSSIFWLGTNSRALDAWVGVRADEARAVFAAHPIVRDRRIMLDLPVKINNTRHAEPWSELKRMFSRDAPMAILISGPGGAGKTTLACSIASRALGTTDQLRLGRHRMLPLLVDADVPEEVTRAGGLYLYVAGLIRSALNENPRVTVALAAALLRSGRVLIIVDGLSERSLVSGRTFDPQRP